MQPFKYIPKLNNGDLRNKVEIHGYIETTNKFGEVTRRFGKIKSTWAKIIPQTGSLQTQAADTILTNVTHKIIVRYGGNTDITKEMKIMFKGREYEIRFILNPFEKNETLEIFVQEVLR